MKLLGTVFVGVAVTVSGVAWHMDRPNLTSLHFPISQAIAAEASQVTATAQFSALATQETAQRETTRLLVKGTDKGKRRTLASLIKRMPWHSSRRSG